MNTSKSRFELHSDTAKNFHFLTLAGRSIFLVSKVHVRLSSSPLDIFMKNSRQVKMFDQ